MSSRKHKNFDAVELMRSIRNNLVRETEGMTVEEVLRWLQSAKFDDPTLALLAQRAAQQGAVTDGAPHRR